VTVTQLWTSCPEVTFDPAKPTAIDPYLLAESSRILLQRVQGVYAEAGVPLPARQLWTTGESAYDCEQLVVALMSLRSGAHPYAFTRAAAPPKCVVFVVATYHISVVRCVPTPDDRGTPPSPEELAKAADAVAVDAYLLLKASCRFDLWGAADEGNSWNYDDGGDMGTESLVEIETAAGGLQAARLQLSTTIG
jgi:hypothetical protein